MCCLKRLGQLPKLILMFAVVALWCALTAVAAEKFSRGTASTASPFGNLPLSFEENRGQTASSVRFLSRGPGYSLFLTERETVLSLSPSGGTAPAAIRMKFVDAEPEVQVSGRDELPGEVNYFRGKDPDQWKTRIRTYRQVQYEQLYPGIDLVFYGNPLQLEYDFVVAPGSDPKQIGIAIEGADNLQVSNDGDLLISVARGEVSQKKPLAYQEIAGQRHVVTVNYVFRDDHTLGFRVGDYEPSAELVIDPVLVYATLLGGSAGDDVHQSAVDANGNLYVAGYTFSADLPVTSGAYDTVWDDGAQPAIYVAKLNASGTAFDFITYLGGGNTSSYDEVNGLEVDSSGNVYLGGRTPDAATHYPTTPGAYQEDCAFTGSFLTKLDSTGSSLNYSTCFQSAAATGIAVDAAGYLYASGQTPSGSDFPGAFPATANAFRSECTATSSLKCFSDVFVLKLNQAGTGLAYATLLGPSGPFGPKITIDPSGYAYVTGQAISFPTTPGAFQTSNPSQLNPQGAVGFVTKLNLDGSALVYSTYLGGEMMEIPFAIAVDNNGNAVSTARSYSDTYPTTANAYSATHARAGDGLAVKQPDVVVSKLNSQGTGLLYSTYLNVAGSFSADYPLDIATGPDDSIWVVGTYSNGAFPTTETILFGCAFSGGVFPAFVSRLNPNAATGPESVVSSLAINGGSGTFVRADTVSIDSQGGVYVGGSTNCNLTPTTTGAADTTYGGTGEGFLWKIDAAPLAENQAPVAVDDGYSTDEDTTLSVATVLSGVLGNDTDTENDALSAAVVGNPAHGTLTLNADGTFEYVPDADYYGTDSFTYKANDGELDSNVATVALTVNPVNDAPIAQADGPFSGVARQPVTVDASASSDVEGDGLTYMWDFGDGEQLNTALASVSHTYSSGGISDVTLTVSDGDLISTPFVTQAEVAVDGGGGQRSDVDAFLALMSPGTVEVSAGTTSLEVRVIYGPTILSGTFAATVNGQPFGGFTPAAGTAETVVIPLDPAETRTLLLLQVDGLRTDGKAATDRDRLTIWAR